MKVALSCLVLCLVAVSAIQVKNTKPYEFKTGKMYVYDYSAQLLTGIPKIADQFSGLKMKAQIVFQAKSSSQEVAMKLTNIKISQSQDVTNAKGGLNLESDEKFGDEEQMAQKWIREYVRELGKPITFTHMNGQVVNFVADENEHEWSLNIKKSILTLFHLNLSPKSVMRPTESNQISKPVSHEDLTYFGVYESGMAGICESVYEIDQIPYFRSAEPTRELVLNVTKTKNYKNCLTRSTFDMTDNLSARHSYGRHQSGRSDKFAQVVRGYYPIPSEQWNKFRVEVPVKQYTTTKYNISLVDDVAQIESIWCEGKVIYTNFGEKIMAYTHQKVTLNKITPARSTLGSISNPQEHDELSFRFPKMSQVDSRMAMDVPHMVLFSDEKVTELTEKLPQLFEYLAQIILESDRSSSSASNNKDAMQKVVQIVDSLASIPRESLEIVYRQIAQAGLEKNAPQKHQVMRKMFLDALALTGSNDAAYLIKQLILNRDVNSHEARELLAALPRNMNLPTTKTLDAYLELLKHPRVASEPLMQPAVGVAFGKMVKTAHSKARRIHSTELNVQQRGQQQQRDSEEEQQILEQADNEIKNNKWNNKLRQSVPKTEDLQKYIIEVRSLLEAADTFSKKVAAIECLAHMGMKEVLEPLEPYITGSGSFEVVPGYEVDDQQDLIKERNLLRTIAIYSLAHVARKNAKQVLPLVLPVYRNTAEPHEMRLAAFTIAMLCNPESHVLESIASDLHRESNKHVTSFVISAFQSIGNLSTPCQKSLAKAAAQAVQSCPKMPNRSYKYSTYKAGDFYDEKHSFGLWSAGELINSRTSPIPRAGYFALSQISSPFHDDILEIGFEAKGLERIVKRIIGSNGLIAQILESKNSQQQQGSTYQYVREQNDASSSSSLRQAAKFNLFVKMFEQTSIYPLDESMIDSAIEQVESWARQAVSSGYTGTFVKVLMPSSISKVAASEIGLPVVVSHRHPLVLSLKVNKVNVQKKTNSNSQFQGFTASVDIEPRFMYSSYAFVYAVEPVEKKTIGTHIENTYHASLPLKLTLTHHHQQSKWSFAVQPKSGAEVVYHKAEALTFLSTAKVAEWLKSAKTIRMINSSPVKVEKTLSHPRVPVSAKVIVEAEGCELKRSSIQQSIATRGLAATLIKIYTNCGLNSREVRIQLEDNTEAISRELRFEWTVKESDISGDYEEELEESYESQQYKQGKSIVEDRNGNDLINEIAQSIFLTNENDKIKYQNQLVKRVEKESQKWSSRARNYLKWINNQDEQYEQQQPQPEQQSQWSQEDREERQRQEDHDNYSIKYYRLKGLQGSSLNDKEIMRTHYVTRDRRVCFTTRPVMACVGGSEPATTKQVTMDFHCLVKSSPLTQQLMKDAQTTVLRQLASKRVDFREEITVPLSCSA